MPFSAQRQIGVGHIRRNRECAVLVAGLRRMLSTRPAVTLSSQIEFERDDAAVLLDDLVRDEEVEQRLADVVDVAPAAIGATAADGDAR